MAELQLLAWPAGHSLSPVMHNAALGALGLPHTYRAVAVPPGQLGGAVSALRQADVLGANVSVPHKEAILPYLDSLSAAARRIGAVNTVSNVSGQLHGDNTDVAGFLALLESAGFTGEQQLKVVLLGAGGAARAALFALSGRARVTVINRTLERARNLAVAFADQVEVTEVAAAANERLLAGTDVIVNTTSVGMERDGTDPDETPLPAGLLPAGATVLDMVYRPATTRLMREAAARGLPALNGLEMLVNQGAASLRIWSGLAEVPVDVMRAAAMKALSDG